MSNKIESKWNKSYFIKDEKLSYKIDKLIEEHNKSLEPNIQANTTTDDGETNPKKPPTDE